MTSILDGYEVFEGDDGHIMDGADDTEYFEIEIDETIRMDIDDESGDDEDYHRAMWHDFDQINPDDLPC